MRSAIGVMTQAIRVRGLTAIYCPLQSVKHEVRGHSAADAPGEDVYDEGHVLQPALPGRYLGLGSPAAISLMVAICPSQNMRDICELTPRADIVCRQAETLPMPGIQKWAQYFRR